MYDLAIIGLGPAGLSAAEIAIKNNLNTIAFCDSNLGGTCLNEGCIPTKSILHVSELYKTIKNADKLGINVSGCDYNWSKILERKNNIVGKFNKLLYSNLSKKITILNSRADLILNNDEIEILANDNTYKAKNIIVATGSKPKELKGLEFDSKFILSSNDLYNLDKLPSSITIVGSGAIGLEWAKIFNDLDVCVNLVEKAPAIAPVFDIDIQKRIERILKLNKISFYKNDFIENVDENKTITLASGVQFKTDYILCAVGRVPVIPKIEISGCAEKYEIKNIENYTSEFENLYFAGDVTNEVMLAHSASYDSKVIMDKILFNKPICKKHIPSVVYITPEIASVGLREQDIDNKNEYQIKKIQVSAIAKYWCDEAYDGFVKVIIKNNQIKGAHIVSKNACSLITMFSLFIEKNITLSQIQDMIFPHPSYEEIIAEVLKID